MELTKVEGA